MTQRGRAVGPTGLDEALRSIRPAMGWVALFSLFINVLVLVPSLYMLQVYDRVMSSRNETTLAMLSVIVVGLLISYAVLEHIRSRVLVEAGLKFDNLVAGPTFRTALVGALRHREGHNEQLTRDVDSLRDFIAGAGIVALIDAPWVPLFLATCFLFHPVIGLVAAGGAAVILALAWANERLTKLPLFDAALLSIRAQRELSASLRNAEVIRGLGMAEAARKRWSAGHGAMLAKTIEANERGGALLAVSKFVRTFLQIAMLGTGAWLAIHQEISPGVIFASSLIMGRALAPIEQAVAQWRSFVAARSAYGRLAAAFRMNPASTQRLRLPRPEGRLSVENVDIYPPGSRTPAVRRASFALQPGEVLAIVGPTGSGKSSLARAVIGAWPAAGGSIRIDGNDITHFDEGQVGEALGYLPQDVELFEGTVADNIARLGARDDEAVIRAAELAGAHEMIQRLADGYQTEIGEGGVALSGGQRQRVGLARAVYGDPALIVLDEPNSNLDGEGDAALVEAIRRLKAAGRTVVVVTHKPSLLVAVDKVLIMHEGTVRRFGSRDELLPLILGHPVVQPVRPHVAA